MNVFTPGQFIIVDTMEVQNGETSKPLRLIQTVTTFLLILRTAQQPTQQLL